MQLKHSFTVPTGLEQAWDVLLDIERIASCMPGAAIETVDGDDFTGTVKVRLGPIGLTYKGKASFIEKDAAGHRAVIDALGKDARGNGTAKARITATLTAQGEDGTAVDVVTDLNITGKPAQFGRGVMVDVGNKLIGQFADCLAGKLAGPEAAGVAASAGPDTAPLGTAEPAAADSVAAELGTADLITARLGSPDPATVERLANTDLVGAEKLGTADLDSAELDSAELGVSAPDADRSAAAHGEAAAGLAELRTAPAVSPHSSIAGPGLADPGAVEPDTAAEAAPPAQSTVAQSTVAQPPAHRPAVADVEPIDLLGSAGPAVAKRVAPVAAAVLLVLLVLLGRRRRSTARSAAEQERALDQARADYRAAVKRWAEAERRAAIERRNRQR